MKFRKATINEIDKLIYLRKKQLVDEGIEPNQNIDTELKEFFTNKMNDGSLIEWIVEDNEEMIATGAIIFYEFPPTYTNKSGKKAYITNMYTKENYRGKGIATKLLTKLVAEAKTAGITKIWLGASKLGRPVYKRFGFKETDEWLELNL
ncbi:MULTISPECIES: GNAT family N-acetyltransferase [Bacillus]|uniref:GNAT family N-acetyltransferase n=1 Tax=Bacillus TaxID=1386 RepID=UPI0001A186E6|nr:GNAT family N-acetyltransferase [Bacillus pseudomycoides]EEM13613.1 GCN5-related N-acetyltransferase [Bacillus pseudomycoides DSM 12442]MED1599567.1 GNAT family N-acetyltransferase [Bacillus pseudomycoides]MED4714479.1 GNAT family N-acetyltransferase [Bacillus pseudomycoides]OOR48972.1 N-acetyltransferase [Bacillus pseudomycoides]PDY09416.1 N-acetyltransferase [Bacillus pseudomycoides]